MGNHRASGTRRGRVAILALGASLGLTLAACKGKKSTDPMACMNECEQECPYTPDSVGDNEDYLECVEACSAKCS